MLLTSTSDIIRVVTSSTADIHVQASWADITTTSFTPGRTNTVITSATTTTVVSSPGASTQRQIKSLAIYNAHASANNTITVQHFDGTTSSTVYKITLVAGEVVQYDGNEWIPVTSDIRPVIHGGTGNATATAYAVIVGGTTSTGAYQSTASGSTGQILQSAGNAAVPTWSTPTYPSASGTSGKFLISDGTNNVYSTSTIPTSAGATALKHLKSDGTNYVLTTATISDSPGTAGKMLVSDGTNWITSTPTFPNSSATTRKIIVSDGTNWVASTETYATPGASGNVLTSDGTNWVSSAPSSGGGGMTMNTASGTTQALAVNNGYICTNVAQCNGTLPATAAVGSLVKMVSQGAGGIKMTANTGQTIKGLGDSTTSGGSVTCAAQYDSLTVICVVANTTWVIDSFVSSLLTFA